MVSAPEHPSMRRSVAGGALVAVGLLILIRLAGPIRLLAVVFLVLGAYSLNKTDPKRLTAIAAVLVLGFGYLAYVNFDR